MTLGAAVTAAGDVTLSTPSLTTGAVTAGAGRTLSLTADTLSLSGDLSASGGRVAFAPFTAGTDMTLGGAGGGGLAITDAVIARVSTGTGTLQIGNGADTGAITIADAVTLEAPQATGLDLRAGGAVTQAGTLSVSRLSASGASVTLTDPENAITSLGTSATNTGAFNLVAGLGPVLQIAEGWTVSLTPKVHKALDERTNPTWPTTWFVPRLTGRGAFTSVYDVMNNWGANHGAIGYGHVGADLVTLASMLRIPVYMHNLPESAFFRPSAWAAFGANEPQGADFRACANFGPLYK